MTPMSKFQIVEAAKVTPVGLTVIGWLTDYAGVVSLTMGALYAILLVAHKLYQMHKEISNDRKGK
jgi:hypothetical protein